MRVVLLPLLLAACSAETGFSSTTDAEPATSTTAPPVADPGTPAETDDTEPVGVAGLRINPDPMSFGDVWVGCEAMDRYTVTNTGDAPTTITELSLDGAVFAFGGPALPLTLEPDATFSVDVAFTPEADGPEAATLAVTSDLGLTEAIAEGNGARTGRVTQGFDVPAGMVDLIFIVDQSSSMDPFQRELNRNFSTFIDDLETVTGDWQLVVANADDGCNTSGILTADTPSYQDIFEARVQQGAGLWIGDHPTRLDREAMLTIAANAADQAAPGRCNEGLLRPGAQLHVIVVSDERDHGDFAWSTYVDRIITAKGGDASLVTISGFVDSGWDNDEGYRQAIAATAGVQAPITAASWAPFMPSLAAHSAPDAHFLLDNHADPDTIAVTVDGTPTDAWEWDIAARTVTVSALDAELAEGDRVEVTYDQVAVCDG
ncbi:MAG: hypothetical protein ACI8PZ_004136 [Myxococcota bacterium]|jgi:hypothetical protein